MKFKETLIKIRNKIAEIKFHFDIAISFLTILNFALLIVAVSDKLRAFLPVGTISLVFILVPIALIVTLLFGIFLDKVVNYQSAYFKEQTKRNPQITEILEKVRIIEKKLEASK